MTQLSSRDAQSSTGLTRTVADFLVELFGSQEIPYAFYNPGSSFREIHDSLIGYGTPLPILCLNEGTAVAAALGFALASDYERPGLALVHGLPGLMQAAISIYNASAASAPLAVISGHTPTPPGSKAPFYDWAHSAPYQDSILGDLWKWYDTPGDPDSVALAARRAFKIALSEPTGPVHLVLPRNLLQAPAPAAQSPRPLAVGRPGPADAVDVERVAERLAAAELPVVHTQLLGRRRSAVAALVHLAETAGLIVDADPTLFVGFPTDHALFVRGTPDLYAAADQVLEVDTLIPAKTTASVLSITSNPSHVEHIQPPIDAEIELIGDAERTLEAITRAFEELLAVTPSLGGRVEARKQSAAARHDRQREAWSAATVSVWDALPLSPRRLAAEIQRIRRPDSIVVHQSVEMGPALIENLIFSEPGTGFLQSGASAYGWAAGAALGIRLARPSQEVIAVVGDGELGYNTAPLYTAAKYGLGILFVVANNRSYSSQTKGYTQINRHAVQNEWEGEGIDLDQPAIGWADLARGYGVWSTTVEQPDDLSAALDEAMAHVRDGEPALVDAIIRPGLA